MYYTRLPAEVTSTSFSTIDVVVPTTTPNDHVAEAAVMLVRAENVVRSSRFGWKHAGTFRIAIFTPAGVLYFRFSSILGIWGAEE